MQVIDLFSGIGGFSLPARWMGWDTVQFCEINPFCQKVLSHHWPETPIHDNVKTLNYETIKKGKWDESKPTILVGGFPCQPFSAAGKRKGTDDDRHLFPEMLRVIREVRPRWIVGENVRGLVNWSGGLVFEQVFADLENEGYEVTAFLVPACSVNAPHRRDRIWFVAYTNGAKQENDQRSNGKEEREIRGNEKGDVFGELLGDGFVAHADGGRQPGKEHGEKKSGRFTKEGFSDYWENFPTQSPICSGNDGIPPRLDDITFPKWRNESIKAYGNAVVPQVVYQIFKAIQEYEDLQ